MIHTLRGKLLVIAIMNMASLLALGVMAIYAAQSGILLLHEAKQKAVAPLVVLETVERDLKEIRFRIAGVALEQLPTLGSANHLKRVRNELPTSWARFHEIAQSQSLPEEEKARIDKIDNGLKELDALTTRLLTAYQGDDNATVKSILENDWPVIHSNVIKPMEQLIPYFQGVVDGLFESANQNAKRMIGIIVTLFGTIFVLVGLMIWGMYRRLSSQLAAARATVGSITELDLTQAIAINGRDEISDLLKNLAAMQDRLRNIVRQVLDSAHLLKQASVEMDNSSTVVADASRRQVESVSSMAGTVGQLSISIDQVREHATRSHEIAVSSGEASRKGREVVLSAASEMVAIAEGARQSSNIVAELGSLSAEITNIVQVIKDIADQTNLLALNAAIEAARAGEQGRGFAVVADEVRQLAERTSLSTTQISDMVQRIQDGTQRTIMAMQNGVERANQGEELTRRAAEVIEQIEQRANDVVRSVNEIHLALREQSTAAKEVAGRSEQIAQMTETFANASSQATQNSNRVAGLAQRLNELVADFRV